MGRYTNFTIRCTAEDRARIALLARHERRQAGDALRELVFRTTEGYSEEERAQLTSLTLAGDAAASQAQTTPDPTRV